MPTYEQFIAHVKDLNMTRSIQSVLGWDQETYMPKRGNAHRADQLAMLAGLSHDKLTSDALNKLLIELAGEFADDPVKSTNIREVQRDHDRARKLPKSLVTEITRHSALAKETWAEARAESNFAKFAPALEKMVDLKRREAEAVGYTTEPYDALMDEFEPGAIAAEVQAVFDAVKAQVAPLVAAIKDAPKQPDLAILRRSCSPEAQAAFNRKIAEAICFDFDAGRIDISVHPFCSSSSPMDVRLTTRYDEHYMPMSLFGTMHEAGHGLYEQGLEAQHLNTPMAQSVSLGIHESQSRMMENQVGRSRPFWEHYLPALHEAFPSLADVSLDDWYFAINNVRPSLIRVEADEVTYNLHIMLRFDIERQLIRGELAIKDVPAAWNAAVESLLGITPKNDAEGCLQDIHWSMGILGYFPTYALGNLYAAQFYAKARHDLPALDDQLRRGEIKPLREWLRTNIHRHGRRYLPRDLVQVVTGEPLSPQPFVDYLNAKFKPLYGLG